MMIGGIGEKAGADFFAPRYTLAARGVLVEKIKLHSQAHFTIAIQQTAIDMQ